MPTPNSRSLLALMRSRRSIRRYSGGPIPQASLKCLTDAAALAPTSRDRKPCAFHCITDRAQLEQLARAKAAGAAFTANAAAAIVVSADSTISDTWIEDSSIALTYMMLEAEALGLGCCWVQMHLRFDADGTSAEENVRRILDLPEQHRIVGFLALGQPEENVSGGQL
ncbi:MAG: nitroreductase family protein [Oscillospiraceae bacterium]|nr:nitroreductase family protein [Oscillospiraceae bacterium]